VYRPTNYSVYSNSEAVLPFNVYDMIWYDTIWYRPTDTDKITFEPNTTDCLLFKGLFIPKLYIIHTHELLNQFAQKLPVYAIPMAPKRMPSLWCNSAGSWVMGHAGYGSIERLQLTYGLLWVTKDDPLSSVSFSTSVMPFKDTILSVS